MSELGYRSERAKQAVAKVARLQGSGPELWRVQLPTIVLLLVSSLAGCANWRPMAKESKPVAEVRQERHAKAVQAFEQTREQAQLASALDRWQQGDIAGCEARLRNLVQSRPQFCEAHVHLAELAWSYENADEAIAEYRAALAIAPNRADVHHALGLVLEATGHSEESQHHLAQAANLEPASELYREAAGAIATSQTPAPIAPTGFIAPR